MSANIVRLGAPVVPAVVTAGVVNTTARYLKFTEEGTATGHETYVRPCLVSNNDAETAFYVRVNVAEVDAATAAVFDFIVPAKTTVDVSIGSKVGIATLSVWVPTGVSAVTDVVVSGWKP